MTQKKLRDTSRTTMPSLTEDEMALWLKEQGSFVIYHEGHHWYRRYAGFFRPVSQQKRLEYKSACRPHKLCWGFSATLKDSTYANGSQPTYLLNDLQNYTLDSLGHKRRQKIRRGLNHIEIVEVCSPELLIEDGYRVVCSYSERTRSMKLPSYKQYLNELKNWFNPRRGQILAGLIEGQLAGFIMNYAVDGTAYGSKCFVATEALSSNISSVLQFEWLQICRRTEGINEAILGTEMPELPSLCRYKKEMNYPLVNIPTRYWISGLASPFVRRLRPHTCYRLTGRYLQNQQTLLSTAHVGQNTGQPD